MKKIISSVCALSIAMLISFNCFAVPASAVSPVAVADAPSIFFAALKSLGYSFSYSPAVSSAASTTASASGYNSYLFNKIIEGAIANGFITGASSASAVGTTIAGGASVTLGGIVLTAGAAAAIVAAAFYIDSQMAEPSTDIFKMPDGSVVNFTYNGSSFDLFANSVSRAKYEDYHYILTSPGTIIPLVTKTYPAGFQFNYDDYWEPFYACGYYWRVSFMRYFTSSNSYRYRFFITASTDGTTWTFGPIAYFYFTSSDTPEQYIYDNIRVSSDGQGHLTLLDDFNIYFSASIYNNKWALSFSTEKEFERLAAGYSENYPVAIRSTAKYLFFPFGISNLPVTSTLVSENSDIIENFASTSSVSSRLEALDSAVQNASADTDVVATIPNITAESMETLPLDLVQSTAEIDAMVIDGYDEPAVDEGTDYAPVDDTWSDAVDTPAAGYDETPPDYPSSDPSATNLLPGNTFAGPWHYVTEVFAYIEEFVVAFLLFFNNALPYSVTALIWACFVLLMLFGLLNRLLK